MIYWNKPLPKLNIDHNEYKPFMTLPLLVLTGLTGIASLFTTGVVKEYLYYIAWLNAFIAGSDIINSTLILIKPSHSHFYRGYYRLGG